MFWTVPLSIIRSYSLYTQQWYMSYSFVDSFLAARSGSWSCCLNAVYKPVWHIPQLSVQWITPDDGPRNCLKHVEFYFQNKFEKLVHLAGFIIRSELLCKRSIAFRYALPVQSAGIPCNWITTYGSITFPLAVEPRGRGRCCPLIIWNMNPRALLDRLR
jgi:hypothetical protein